MASRHGHGTPPPPGALPVRLSPGSHSSPEQGVCVVEMASVLAKEKFSDRPRCVCAVIGAFLRGWNDRATHAERQRLAPYAARIVGSRGDRQVTRARRDLCLEWTGADLGRGLVGRFLARMGMRLRIAVYCSIEAALRLNEGAGDYASRVAAVRGDADAALELLEALLVIGMSDARRPGIPPIAVNGNGRPPTNGNGRGHENGHGRATTTGNGLAWTNGNGRHEDRRTRDTLPGTDVGVSNPSADQDRSDERLGAGR